MTLVGWAVVGGGEEALHRVSGRLPVADEAMSHDLRIDIRGFGQRADDQRARDADAEFPAEKFVKDEALWRGKFAPHFGDGVTLLAGVHHSQRLENLLDHDVQCGRTGVEVVTGDEK